MDICQFCGMYMKPMFDIEKSCALCEFCGERIAEVVDGKWKKIEVGGKEIEGTITPSEENV